MKQLTSRQNPHFKALKKLVASGRERRKSGLAVLEGMHLLGTYTQYHGSPEALIVSEKGRGQGEIAAYLAVLGDAANITVLCDDLFDELASVETPSGIMAVIRQPQNPASIDRGVDSVILDGLQDAGNLGSILRTAAAAGFRQVLLSADCAQAWSPKTLRAAMGAHFQIDIHENVDLVAFLESYRGLAIATRLGASESLYALKLKSPVAWVFGNEGQGIRAEVAAAIQKSIEIPMPGATESLNVAAAAAICIVETVRQRQETSCA